MEDYQQHTINEKKDLDVKLGKLAAFLQSDDATGLTEPERVLLQRQYAAMDTYSRILFERIEVFSAVA